MVDVIENVYEVLYKYPSTCAYIATDVRIVHHPYLESAIVKTQSGMGEPLTHTAQEGIKVLLP